MSLSEQGLYRFDEFELDRLKRTLLRDGRPVSLAPKAFDVLTQLVVNPGKVVTKDELISAVWAGSFVEEGNLAHHISSLRRAFADRAGYIVTIPGRGYQFAAEVVREGPASAEQTTPQQPAEADPTVADIQRVRERTHIVVEETIDRRQNRLLSRGLIFCVGGALVTVALAGFVGWRWMHPHSYGHVETVIADLDNETGDADFDHSLNRMLQIDLQQSPYFTIVSDGRARGILKMMRQPVDGPITSWMAHEICQRLNGQMYVTPAISKVGDRYLLSLEANDCNDGHSLGAAHSEVTSKGEVLPAFTALARRVRRNAGESSESLQRFNTPLFSATPASLDALKEYAKAIRLVDSGNLTGAIALYKHVVELDPKFAVAYSDMSGMYYNMGDRAHDQEAIAKAYALRDTVNERERLAIEYRYHMSVTGDLHAQLDVLRQWASIYTEDNAPLAALVNLETWTGQYSAAAATADRMLALQKRYNSHGSINYEIAARAYHHANMPDKLRAVYADALLSKTDGGGLRSIMLVFAAENGDTAGVEREIQWSRGKPEEAHMLQYAALSALASGQARRAAELFSEASVAAQRDKLQDSLVDFDDYHARLLVELGLSREAQQLLHRLPPTDPSLDKAFTEAEIGDTDAALAEAKRQQTAAPNDVLLHVEYAPSVQAAVALRQRKPDQAIALLKTDAPYELRDPTVPYLRGQAYLALRQSPLAAAEFEKLVDRPWLAEPSIPLTALAQLGLARAYALDRRPVEARRAYDKFFSVWKGADTGLPVLQQAHLEEERIR